jgi:hypothetical protein
LPNLLGRAAFQLVYALLDFLGILHNFCLQHVGCSFFGMDLFIEFICNLWDLYGKRYCFSYRLRILRRHGLPSSTCQLHGVRHKLVSLTIGLLVHIFFISTHISDHFNRLVEYLEAYSLISKSLVALETHGVTLWDFESRILLLNLDDDIFVARYFEVFKVIDIQWLCKL